LQRLIFILFFVVLLTPNTHAQYEAQNWYMGDSIGLKITRANGIENVTGNTIRSRYTAVCSDSAGNVLFYTDGSIIKNRNNQPMPGSSSLGFYNNIKIVRHPGNLNKYLIFKGAYAHIGRFNPYVPDEMKVRLQFTEIDMSQNGGLGGIGAFKDSLLSDSTGIFELVQHENKKDIWLVRHKYRTDTFNVFLINSAGLSSVPVISVAGSVSNKSRYIPAHLRASNDGKLLAMVTLRNGCDSCPGTTLEFAEVFTFNRSAGTLSSRNLAIWDYLPPSQRLLTSGYGNFPLFSPDNRLLYLVRANIIIIGGGDGPFRSTSVCDQYNLCYTNPVEFTQLVQRSVLPIWNYWSSIKYSNIELAPNKVIIASPGLTRRVSAIRMPNIIGGSCYPDTSYYVVNNKAGSEGLAAFFHSYIEETTKNNIVYEGGCQGDSLRFFISDDTVNEVSWDFGDIASGASNFSTLVKPKHRFSSPGKYTVKATIYSNGIPVDFDSTWVEVKDTSIRLLHNYPRDTSFCFRKKIPIKLSGINGIFRWSVKLQGQTNIENLGVSDTIDIRNSGKYYVEFIQNGCGGCVLRDSINVTAFLIPQIDFGADRQLCSGDSIKLSIFGQGSNTTWSTGDTTAFIWVKQPGTYWATDWNSPICKSGDTITITGAPAIQFSLPADTALCENTQLVLRPGVTGASYRWHDNSSADSFTVTSAGSYWVRVSKNGCTKRDTINVSYFTPAAINLGPDTSICKGAIVTLGINTVAERYTWNTGASASQIVVGTPGLYWLQAVQNNCIVTDSIIVANKSLAGFSIGSDTSICEKDTLSLNATVATATSYLWSNNATTPQLKAYQPNWYWCDVTNNGCIYRDSLQLTVKPLPMVNLGADTVLCEEAILQLTAFNNNASYSWQDNSNADNYTVNKAGKYYVAVNKDGCIAKDTINISYTLKPRFSLGNDQLICIGQSITLQPTVDAAWQLLWQDGSTASTLTVTKAGIYSLEATNTCGSQNDEVVFTEGNCNIYIPSAFAPNSSNAQNKVFRVSGTALITQFRLQVYNRYGVIVFETADKNKGWDGYYKGQPAQPGTYVYLLQYKDNKKTQSLKGSFLLVR